MEIFFYIDKNVKINTFNTKDKHISMLDIDCNRLGNINNNKIITFHKTNATMVIGI